MAVFDWTIAGSGAPIQYGKATIRTDGPVRSYSPVQNTVTAVQPSGSTTYFDNLNNRYINEPSGWNI